MKNSPVRMVCVSCLRSVELLYSDEPNSQLCPYCGGEIETELGDAEVLAGDPQQARTRPLPPDGEHHATVEWESTWERGSLGRLGRFHFRDRLGDGGFGQVYLAYDPRLDRDVAVKVLKQPQPSARVMERFFREARAVARLDHPNIVTVHDAGYSDGRCWVAYQLVTGRPLSWYRDQRRLEPNAIAKIIMNLSLALHHAHSLGVVHRDLKPANILIDEQGRPRLIDFGLARMFDVESDLTRDGAVVGTPFYMAPEQAMGFSAKVDERSDVYSLGVILLELLTGRQITELSSERSARGYAAAIAKPLTTPDPKSAKPANRAKKIRQIGFGEAAARSALLKVCDRAMASDPANRYANAKELAADLGDWLDRQRNAPARLSFSLACVIMGLAASVLLVVGLKSAITTPNPRTEAAHSFLTAPPVPASLPASASAPVSSERAPALLSPPPATVAPQPTPAPVPGSSRFVGNRETHKVHRSDCTYVQRITESHRQGFDTVAAAVSDRYSACGTCRPHD